MCIRDSINAEYGSSFSSKMPFDSPLKAGAALDLTKDNRAVVAEGDLIKIHTQSTTIDGWSLTDSLTKKNFTPRKLILQNESHNTLILTPDRKNVVQYYDTERGALLRRLEMKNFVSDLELNIDELAHKEKFSNLKQSSVLENVAIAGNIVCNVQWDPRAKGDEFIITDKSEVKTKGKKFTCVATTGKGHVAVGTNTGEINLYTTPSKSGKWTKAKTTLNQIADPVIGVDVSKDGEWILWTTKEYLALSKTVVTTEAGNVISGYEGKGLGANKPSCIICRLSPQIKEKYGIGEVNFSPAKFDNGPFLPDDGVIEDKIVTSTGPFVVNWSFRQLKHDYNKKQNDDQGLETSVLPQVLKQSDNVVDKVFEYGDPAVVVLSKQLSRIELD
eukprot:TRINITY_DN2523_c0_g1_i2.p1 TRINITY_DN2523_c0_g1~~TRINITY_DN2523_c0_g1_i2.p1  ORF type:complete len:387 (+),score=109.25 TRINITY_DN2523_c0_g1_i2:30-1190(+)